MKQALVRIFSSVALLLTLFSSALAVEISGLFEVEIVANSQSEQDRQQAMKQALYAVLNRVVVAEDIAQLPVVQNLLSSAQHYVSEFQYSLASASDYGDNDVRLIRVKFDEAQLLEVLRASQAEVWSEIRPETLLWLVVDDGGKQFYNADAMPDIESALALASKMKALPLIYPMLDLEEQQRISVSEVLGADSRRLLSASQRYEVPAVMAGRLSKKADCWAGEWAFYFDGRIKQWSGNCGHLKSAVLSGVEGAYKVLGHYYGVKPEQNSAR